MAVYRKSKGSQLDLVDYCMAVIASDIHQKGCMLGCEVRVKASSGLSQWLLVASIEKFIGLKTILLQRIEKKNKVNAIYRLACYCISYDVTTLLRRARWHVRRL